MSRKGCSPDNAACEGFFGRLKNEMFYGYSWSGVSINQFIEVLDKYIIWYAEKRIKISLGGMSPLDYRRSLGLIVQVQKNVRIPVALNQRNTQMPKKSFIKGRKQELEILFMYYWLHDMEGDSDYWQEYLEMVLLGLKKTL